MYGQCKYNKKNYNIGSKRKKVPNLYHYNNYFLKENFSPKISNLCPKTCKYSFINLDCL